MQLSKSEITPFSQGTAVYRTVWDQKENVRPPIRSPLCSWLLALWASPTGPRGNEDPRHPLCPHRPSAETSTLIKSPGTSSCHLCAWSKWRAEHTGSSGWPCLHSFLGEERANCSRVIRNPRSPHLGSLLYCPLAWQPAVTAGSAPCLSSARVSYSILTTSLPIQFGELFASMYNSIRISHVFAFQCWRAY